MELNGIDMAVVDALREVGGDSLIEQLFELFLDYTPKRLEGIRSAIDSNNGDELAYWSHSLRSGAASLGALDLAARAEKLERLARRVIKKSEESGKPVALGESDVETYPELVACYRQFEQILRGYLGEQQRREAHTA